MEADLKPGESLQLFTLLATVLRQPDKDKPSQEIWLFRDTLNLKDELAKRYIIGKRLAKAPTAEAMASHSS